QDDDSIPVVKEVMKDYSGLRALYNDLGRGIIFALKKGVTAAKGRYVLIFAADEVGPILALDDMLKLAQKGCEFISCTRYAYGGRRLGGSQMGKLLSHTAN